MRRALVTGAGRRVGRAIALALGKKGFHVGVHYNRSKDAAEETAKEIEALGGKATLFSADLYDAAAPKDLVRRTVATLGGLDLLVASAANFDRVAIDDVTANDWQRAMSLNLEAPFWMAHEARTALRQSESGNIVFITGFGTTRPYRNFAPYLIAKGALKQATRVLALEFGPEIRVNAVAPGTVLPPEDLDDAAIARLASQTALKKIGTADAVAHTVVHLDGAHFTTGTEVIVDGGATIVSPR